MNGTEHLRDVAAEEAVLARMTWGAEAVDAVVDVGMIGSDFTSAARETIFTALVQVREKDFPVDLVTLHDELRRRGQADRCGGSLELARIADLAPSGADVVHYAAIVRRLGRRRALVEAAQRLARRAADLTVPDEELTTDRLASDVRAWGATAGGAEGAVEAPDARA